MLLSATPWTEAAGHEEALARVMLEHPWFGALQELLGGVSILLDLGLAAAAILFGSRLLRTRLAPFPLAGAEALRFLATYGVIFFGVFILSAVIRKELGPLLERHGITELHLILFNVALTQALVLLLVYGASRSVHERSGGSLLRAWGFNRPASALLGIPLFLATVFPVGALIALTAILFKHLGLDVESQPLVLKLWQNGSNSLVALFSISAVTLVPLVEEMVFRGFLYPTIRRAWGVGAAVALSSLIFALVHFHAASFLPLFALAVILSLSFELTGSLPACVVAHSMFNATTILLIWLLRSTVPAGI